MRRTCLHRRQANSVLISPSPWPQNLVSLLWILDVLTELLLRGETYADHPERSVLHDMYAL